ncbi:MAG TPA: hypothetical protein EYQ12_02990, partial [Oceanospirillaceae bacterium]|nr:hypothetical protein [Oceanospirillaceae bacterium]
MSVQQLSIQRLRNLDHVEVSFGSGINLLYGANASGKTSVLEAIHMLSLGRSFRSLKLASVIAQNQSDCLLFAKLKNKYNTAGKNAKRRKRYVRPHFSCVEPSRSEHRAGKARRGYALTR